MLADDVFASLNARFSKPRTRQIVIGADEIQEWPSGLFNRLSADKLLSPIEPTQSLECQGCERACIMTVTVTPVEGNRAARAFISCDKPENFGRIPVAFTRMHQWQMTRTAFERLEKGWITTSTSGQSKLKKSKAPLAFRNALERLLTEIATRAASAGMPFDHKSLPGRKIDLHAVAVKFDQSLDLAPRTFDDYLDGLYAFKRGARKSDFYAILFPEFLK